MKINFILLLVLFSSIVYSQDWVVKNQDETLYLTSVHFTDNNFGIAIAGSKSLITHDGGETWREVDTLGNVNWTKVSGPPKSKTLFVCGPNGKIGKLKSGTFTELNSGTDKILSGIDFPSETTGYVVGQDGIFLKTTNGGLSWNSLSSGTNEWLNNVVAKDTDDVVIVGDKGIIRKSSDGGNTLSDIMVPGINSYLGDAAFITTDNFWIGGSEGTLFNVTPTGNNILNIGSNDGIMGLNIPVPNFGVGVGDNGAIFEYNGTDWTRQNSPTTAWLNDVTAEPDTDKGNVTYHFWAVGEKGTILKKTISVVSINETVMPNNYFVSNNYPNPFNPSTKFNYTIPFLSNVSIELYNMLGEKISTIKNEINDIGTYTILIDGKDLSSGIYFVKFNFHATDFQSNEYNTTKKILLIK